jgi:Cu/Ag efflux pump CusA
MIRAFVDYSLRNKLLVLAVGILLLAWGAVSFQKPAGRGLPGRRE